MQNCRGQTVLTIVTLPLCPVHCWWRCKLTAGERAAGLLGCWAVSGHGEELSCDKKTDELIAPLLLSCSPRHHRTPVAGLLFISSSSSSSAPQQRRSRFLRSTFHCVLVSSLWSSSPWQLSLEPQMSELSDGMMEL